MLTPRQKDILRESIGEYISLAQPVSSQLLEEHSRFDVSPATIRNELQILTERGFLFQPHISSGRVPTDRGYRFFVNEILQKGLPYSLKFEEDIQSPFDLLKALAEISSQLVIGYDEKGHQAWKEGWEKILLEPEFEERKLVYSLTKFINDMEERIEQLLSSPFEIYIGKENPCSHVRDFSIMVSHYSFGKDQTGTMILVGPKRMPYERNIGLMKSIEKLFV